MQELILIRGLPGSGKTTLAHKFRAMGYLHFEADMFFEKNGEYVFDAKQLGKAHSWCLKNVSNALSYGANVVVSNTFTQLWELSPYFFDGVKTTVLTCEGNFENIHNVPPEKVKLMRERWERYGD